MRRIGRYWWLIALLVGAGMVAGLAHGNERTYTATARIVLDTPDPATRQEAVAIADTVQAIATSPRQVQTALRRASVRRDPLDVAKHHVSATGLGSSAIVQLSVSDTNARVAARIANALASQVIHARENVTRGTSEQQLSELDSQITGLSAKISDLEGTIATLNADIATTGTSAAARRLRATRDTAVRQHDLFARRRAALESARVSVLASFATRANPSIISSAEVPTQADSSGRLQYMVLGGLLGLVLALAIAAILELMRPTVVGGDALAAELGVPLLGTVTRFGNVREQDISRAALRIKLASEAAELSRVELLAWSRQKKSNQLLEALQRSVAALGVEVAVPGARAEAGAAGSRESPAAREMVGPSSRPRSTAAARRPPSSPRERPTRFTIPRSTGSVLVSPNAVNRRDLLEILDVLNMGRSTLLGLVVYSPSVRFRHSLAVPLDAVRAHASRGSAETR